jgi:hypothetical protein
MGPSRKKPLQPVHFIDDGKWSAKPCCCIRDRAVRGLSIEISVQRDPGATRRESVAAFTYPNAYPNDGESADIGGHRRIVRTENTLRASRTLASGAKGRKFESDRAHHTFRLLSLILPRSLLRVLHPWQHRNTLIM